MNFFKLSNLSIAKQLLIISTISVTGFLLNLALFYQAETKSSQLRYEVTVETQRQKAAQKISYEFLNARRREKDFLIRSDAKYIKKHAGTSANIHKDLDELKAQYKNAPEYTAQIDVISEGYQNYETHFKKIVDLKLKLGLSEKEGLRGLLRSAVHNVETDLKKANDFELMTSMLMLRRHEKDFLARKTPKYVDRINKEIPNFKEILVNSYLVNDTDKQKISSLIDDYQKGFIALSRAVLTLQKDVKLLSQVFAETSPKMAALEAEIINTASQLVDEQETIGKQAFTTLLVAILIIIAFVSFVAWFVSRNINKLVGRITDEMTQLADNDLSVEITGISRSDELGRISKAMQIFKDNAKERQRLEKIQKKTQQEQVDRAKEIEDMANNFENKTEEMITTVNASTEELSASSNSLTSIADQTSERAGEVAEAVNVTSQNMQAVTTATEELTTAISEVNGLVSRNAGRAKEAMQHATQASQQVGELDIAVKSIGEIVTLIQDIAEQTNLLALNATIEAARAGDAGKGFAVVASEVKNLAAQTGKATEEITEQINTVQTETTNTVQIMTEIADAINQIGDDSTSVAAAIEEQGSATQEISRNIQQANNNALLVKDEIDMVSQSTNETENAAGQLRTVVDDLSAQSGQLKGEIEGFLTRIKSA